MADLLSAIPYELPMPIQQGTRAWRHRGVPTLKSGDDVVGEDGILSDLGVDSLHGGGPARAIADFLARGDRARYEIDGRYCDYSGRNVTWNVDGWLRCIA
jgi:cephalosporin hydroxylase